MGYCAEPFWVRLPYTLIGTGTVGQVGELVKHLGGNKVLIVTDPGVVQAGLLEKVKQPLEKEGIESGVFDNCEPDCPVNVAHYCASKFAVIGITQSLARELGQYDINVNAVCPGIVRTAMWEVLLDARSKRQELPREQVWDTWMEQTPLKRPQTPEDMANVVLFLSSEISRNITGEAISVNGGLYMD